MDSLIGFGNVYVVCLWLFSLFSFFIFYIRELSKKRLITVLSFTVIFYFFIPIILQYPFTFSELNIMATKEGYEKYVPKIDSAFIISFTGMAFFIFGYFFSSKINHNFLFSKAITASLKRISQKTHLSIIFLLTFALFVIMIKIGFVGEGGSRYFAMQNPSLRPIYNIIHTFLPYVVAIMLIAGTAKKSKFILALGLTSIALGIFTGTRSAAFGGVIFYLLVLFSYKSLNKTLKTFDIVKIFTLTPVLIILGLFLSDAREGNYNIFLTIFNAGPQLFYGNNFSDLRDFAWMLSYWDDQFLFGKTQLAGILSFIPSSLSSFRNDWSWGAFSTEVLNLDHTVHPGVRPGVFGEPYFNFGWIGVIAAGFMFGYVTQNLNQYTKTISRENPFDSKIGILGAYILSSLFWNFLITAGFYGFYLIIFFLIGFYILDVSLRNNHIPVKGKTSTN